MNKKFFLSMFAAAGMLFAASCSNDELDAVQSGDEAQVTFSIGIEDGIGTKAISDGTGADVLNYAIYDANETLITSFSSSTNGLFTKTSAFPGGGKAETVQITLTKGQNYTAVFWAQNSDCMAYSVSAETNAFNIGVNYQDGKNNDETRDAFFAAESFRVTGNTDISVELKRPFAQINVGVTQADWNAAIESGSEITESKVVIKNAANSINLLDGSVSGEEVVTYDFATIPAKFTEEETLKVDVDCDGTIQENEVYKHLSMSYILVDKDKTTLESDGLQFTFSPAVGEDIVFDEGLHNVPVQRNWRTNILGQILTGDIKFNITINPIFDNDYNYPEFEEVTDGVKYDAANKLYYVYSTAGLEWVSNQSNVQNNTFKGYTIKLTSDVDMTNVSWTPIGTTVAFMGTFDGSNHTISNLVVNITSDRGSAGLFANVQGNIKNVKMTNVNISGHYKAGAIVGSIYGNIDNCHVDGGIILSTPGSTNDDANNVGGIVGYVSENSKTGYTVSNCSVKNLNVTAYRSVGGVAGRLMTGATVKNCTVDNTVVTADMLCEYADSKYTNVESAKAGEIVGDNRFDSDLSTNTYNNVTVNVNAIVDGVASVSNNTQLEFVLDNANTHTVMLGSGKYVASLYPGDIPARTSLTIIGTEGTQFAYTGTNYGGQLGIDKFDNFTIKNCEILRRENVKNWGMVVFGSSNNANGVYTFDNCTFKGVGTQGIYINEQTSGATYNILNCTFDGNFGSEGVISIQNNDGVNHTVNVLGCTFNTTSKKIHVHYAYNGWTLNTDLQASTAADITTLANAGLTTINLAEGEYTLPSALQGKTLTIKGTEETVISVQSGLTNVLGSTLTFEGVTIQSDPEGAGYTNGIKDGKYAIFNKCVINGTLGLDFSCEFNECTFNIKGDYYNLWTWGAATATFYKCTFNSDGKALLVYPCVLDNGGTVHTVNIKNCVFNDNGAIDGKAAIEITDTYPKKNFTFNVNISETKVNGFSTTSQNSTTFGGTDLGTNVWGNKNLLPADRLNVVIDGTEVY